MSTLAKVGIGLGAVSGMGGVGYGIYSVFRTLTYAEILSGTLLSTKDNEDKDKWTKRLESLKQANNDTLTTELKAIKDKSQPSATTWDELRDWCKKNINNQSKGEKDKEFQGIQNYCTFSIKEKITNSVDEGTGGSDDSKWAVGHGKLQKIDDSELDSDLVVAKGKKNGAGNTAVKEWCVKAYKKPYKGKDDKDYKNASRVCVSS
ncbi:hypothetical protein A6V39_05170 [Candidatus Mycoplasma haematobovis]|uniref:Uncharacterized protein n=1 Tax=Candidatus Mycoplasma haematobovis TaxID=432608 RepID=A0A1A9QDQ2_9MOLU|nr:hypothetical protein [Candidatus Mycoplasma haematobovis]OAL09819.1 hypothetical protein A6V39_05170 [Candidatus Mycoplasma haematobovis]